VSLLLSGGASTFQEAVDGLDAHVPGGRFQEYLALVTVL
jgi:hypothetical protein